MFTRSKKHIKIILYFNYNNNDFLKKFCYNNKL